MMRKDRAEPKSWQGVALTACALMMLLTVGCRKSPSRKDQEKIARDTLRTFLAYKWLPPEAQKRIQTATAMLDNSIIDPKPILMAATLSRTEGSNEIHLGLLTFDEAEDLAGFIVREEAHDPNGSPVTREEDYPVYAHFPAVGIANIQLLRVHIREAYQRKDEKVWAEYLAMDFEGALEQAIKGGAVQVHASRGSWGDPAWDARHRFWEATLPPIWVSRPDPAGVTVWVRVYDKAGNRSDAVRVTGVGTMTEAVPADQGTAQ